MVEHAGEVSVERGINVYVVFGLKTVATVIHQLLIARALFNAAVRQTQNFT